MQTLLLKELQTCQPLITENLETPPKNLGFLQKEVRFYFSPIKVNETIAKLRVESRSSLAEAWELGTKRIKFIEHK